MDANTVFTVLAVAWILRYVVGLCWGIYLVGMLKLDPKYFDLADTAIVGLLFWTAWWTGRLIKWAIKRIKR
jgi:hypothetical protein